MKIDVCYTPELIHQFDLSDKTVVVIDILRATSCMVAGLGSGVKKIMPVATVAACEALGQKGYIMAGERDGCKLPQFDIGNSPFDYIQAGLKGSYIAATTTNGTRAIELAREASEVIIGAFLNLSAVVQHLRNQKRDTLLLCSGWKGRYNLEDSLFAGAVCEGLAQTITLNSDEAIAALHLYRSMAHNLSNHICNSNHADRLARFGVIKDAEYCAKVDQFNIVPRLIGDELSN